MTVLLLRHADAGERDRWAGSDETRPLTTRGEAQATALVDILAGYPVARILTSRYQRCRTTVDPLAAARGLPVEEHEDLAEGASLDKVSRLLLEPDAVLCTHADVIGAVLWHLAYRGVKVGDNPTFPVGSAWMIDMEADTARYVPPPPGDSAVTDVDEVEA